MRDRTAFDQYHFEEWRRVSIPDWKRILAESVEKKDTRRIEAAQKMLKELLED